MSQSPLKVAEAKLIEKKNLLKKLEKEKTKIERKMREAEKEIISATKVYNFHLYLNPTVFY